MNEQQKAALTALVQAGDGEDFLAACRQAYEALGIAPFTNEAVMFTRIIGIAHERGRQSVEGRGGETETGR